ARYHTLRHMLEKNIGLIVMRQVFQQSAEYTHVGVADTLIDERTFYSNRGGTYLVPARLVPDGGVGLLEKGLSPNATVDLLQGMGLGQASGDNGDGVALQAYLLAV